ncbi:MAG: type II secretion system F family protein [Gemmatimonadales bacterium]|nr:type II secretion system F family protein [Gemmatimonadales bacterium]
MIYLIAILVAAATVFVVMLVLQLIPSDSAVIRRLGDMQRVDGSQAVLVRRRRQERAERLKDILEGLGSRVGEEAATGRRLRLMQAGFVNLNAPYIFQGARVVLALGFGFLLFSAAPILGVPFAGVVLVGAWGVLMGWVLPGFYVGRRIARRQYQMQRSLPDALDLLVVCVEAGLALNQAILRVSEEIANIGPVLGEQLAMVNLEIRAGTGREEALQNLAMRTGVDDIQSFVSMLIQTDRFGTSIADALRIHSEDLRTKRRQEAEEQSAKTAIKMLFPLVFCIFPAMFVVILGAAIIQIVQALSRFG